MRPASHRDRAGDRPACLLSYSRFRALLRRHNYVYRQLKHDLSGLHDAVAKTAAEELLDWLKKIPETLTIQHVNGCMLPGPLRIRVFLFPSCS